MEKLNLRYFSPKEFTMNNGSVNVFQFMDTVFLKELDEFRHRLGFFIKPTSSYRSESFNISIGGAKNSMHLTGRAIDADITRYTGEQRAKFMQVALEMGFTVGVSKNFFHIDNRKNQTVFGY